MLDILRGAAGALSDLVEEERSPARGVASSHPAATGGAKGPDPRASEEKGAKEKSAAPSEYSYESEAEDPREDRARLVEVKEERSESEQREGGGGHSSGSKPSVKPRVAPGVDPHYLSKALHLRAAPKQSPRDRDAEDKRERGGDHRPREEHRGDDDEEPEGHNGPRGAGAARPVTPERAPIERRRPTHNKKKGRKRGTGGKSKRERAQDFKEWVQEKKRRREEDQRWHQRRR